MANTDETVEYCPRCRSSIDLGPATDIVTYIMNPITGAIVNTKTGEPHPYSVRAIPSHGLRTVRVYEETKEDYKDRVEAEEDAFMLRFAALMDSGKSTYDAYWQALKEKERPERKFHTEEINF